MTQKTMDKKHAKELREDYYKRKPWMRAYYKSRTRAKIKGREHTLTMNDFKDLWFRDKGWELKRPSIDRIDNDKGYIQGNCRFIELSQNSRLGGLVKVKTEKERKLASDRFKKLHEEGVLKPWNKGNRTYRKCERCNNEFEVERKTRRFCSNSCAKKKLTHKEADELIKAAYERGRKDMLKEFLDSTDLPSLILRFNEKK
jgi:hypothetical protein